MVSAIGTFASFSNPSMFHTYILKSTISGRFYVGSCEDTGNRQKQHNSGYVKSTKPYLPWELIYEEEFLTLKEARQRERQIKLWKKRSAIEKIVNKKNP